ncbi:membrane-associated proteins in eicosanoid and glutathione metabolism [Lepidopterella palustris CBS 459.81]|uniref:Membrane-associated proteins in eicosanoid and glutathione metabolism n=1 Tax=Lepidopterella palustris CBS 459.81 TaxID=1314670 RepID=A0A8E2DZD2_9PEZI|nr:membrane-associated proteins in eicosanoid and glutathione metabolism [Lepidopterella palustris CBS 459.81]
MVTVEIPSEYGYVMLTAVSTLFIATWHGIRVGSYRKAAKIPYPYEYASYEQISTAPPASQKAMYLFNCAQRAHQNYNENHPSALAALMIGGVGYPRAAAVAGAVWAVNRIIYAVGYTRAEEKAGPGEKKGGKGRYYGILWNLAHLVLVGLAGKTGWDLVMA